VELRLVPVEKPDGMNVIIGQAHFIKTVEDLHEALVGDSRSHRRYVDVLETAKLSYGRW
jgi:adenosine/AMP kinase